MFSFVKNCKSSKVALPCYIPTSSDWELLLLHILTACGVVSVSNFSHSNRCVEESHCCFSLQFPNEVWYGASFHMLICHLYIFFTEVSIQTFLPLFDWAVCFLLRFKSSLYILDTSPLSDMCFINIFPQCVALHRAEVFNFN